MDPIVNGIKKEYVGCMQVERVNFHKWSTWHDLLYPIGSPEFDLLDSSKSVLYRWFGVVDKEEFTAVLDPLCG
jgi:hypothetical protein